MTIRCSEGKPKEGVFTDADARRIASVAPVTPGWSRPRKSERSFSPGSPTESVTPDPLLAKFKRQTAHLVDLGEAGNRWQDKDEQVTYHWRPGNLVIEAHVHCLGLCPGDVDAAARTWVDAIDAEARRVPN